MTEDIAKYENKRLSIIENVDIQQVAATMQKIANFQAIVRSTLKEGHDYGIIPGTGSKPTLFKPGAEKILMLLGLTSGYEVTERIQDYAKGFFAFTVKCQLSRNGFPITEGFGHANTKEARYDRRWVTESKLPPGTDKSVLQKREKVGKYGKYFEYLIENDDPYTLVNTVLKMAKKRAQVDAVLTVASLSEIFTQDLEDMAADDIPFDIPQDEESKTTTTQKQQQQRQQQSKTKQDKANPPANMATEAQKNKIFAMAAVQGLDKKTMTTILSKLFCKSGSKELTKKEASTLIDVLSDPAKVGKLLEEEEKEEAQEQYPREDLLSDDLFSDEPPIPE